MNARRILNDDAPAPQPPVQPDLDDCCRSGCVPCVFDLYEEAIERHRIELKVKAGNSAFIFSDETHRAHRRGILERQVWKFVARG